MKMAPCFRGNDLCVALRQTNESLADGLMQK